MIEPIAKRGKPMGSALTCGGRNRRCGTDIGKRMEMNPTGDEPYPYLHPPLGWHYHRRPGDFAYYLRRNRDVTPRRPMPARPTGIRSVPLDKKGRGISGETPMLPATVVCPACGARNAAT